MLQIVASLTDDSRGVIYDCNTGANLIKLFGINLLMLFCKLYHFINENIIFCVVKGYSFQKRVSKHTPKKFYEIDSRPPLESLRRYNNDQNNMLAYFTAKSAHLAFYLERLKENNLIELP